MLRLAFDLCSTAAINIPSSEILFWHQLISTEPRATKIFVLDLRYDIIFSFLPYFVDADMLARDMLTPFAELQVSSRTP